MLSAGILIFNRIHVGLFERCKRPSKFKCCRHFKYINFFGSRKKPSNKLSSKIKFRNCYTNQKKFCLRTKMTKSI